MKQEHRFVAELYRYLAPFVDPDKPIYLSLDGEAAKKGVHEKRFQDSDIPDLWFNLINEPSTTLLEAKTLYSPTSIKLSQGQLVAWRTNGPGSHRPTAWVVASSDLREFHYWRHRAFLERLDGCRASVAYPEVRMPEVRETFTDIRALVLHILRDCRAIGLE